MANIPFQTIDVRVLDAEDNYNLLFVGPPASAKTLFLLGILESRKGKGVYFFFHTHNKQNIRCLLVRRGREVG